MARVGCLFVDPIARVGYETFRVVSNGVADDVAGFSLAFGVLQEYYSSHPEELEGDVENVAVIGTTVTVIFSL